jgi:5'-phosphate synthase pdxT subunit
MQKKIGILALQGDFAKHEAMLQSLHVKTVQVKTRKDLQGCDGLIIPGGESTTLTKLLHVGQLYEPIRELARCCPIMGTCAGMIMVAAEVDDHRVTPLRLIDIAVTRNAYGRQIDSFITDVNVPFLGDSETFRAIFIRAPQINRVGSNVETLIAWQGQPIMVRANNILALAFHPELTNDPRIHHYFLKM